MLEDHALHFFVLGGPDFIVGPEAPAARAQHRRRDRQGRRRGRQEGHRHAPPPARADRLLRRQGDPSRARPARRRQQGAQGRRTCRSSRNWPRTRVEFAQFTLAGVQRHRAQEPRLREADHLATPTPTGPITWAWWTSRTKSTSTTASCAWWTATARNLQVRRRSSIATYVAEHVEPWSYMKFCLPEAARLEWLRRRPGEQHLRRGSAGAPERRRRHGHAQGAGGLRGVLQDARRQARASHAGQPLGARGRDDPGRRAHGANWSTIRRSPAPTSATFRPRRPRSASAWSRRRAARCSIITRPTSAA